MARPNNAAAIAAHVQGLREAKAAFQAMPEVFRNRLNDATELTLREIVRHAKGNIQASPSIRTRSLLNAIAFTLNRKSGRGRAGVARVTTTLNVGGRKVKVKGIIIAGRGGSALTKHGAKKIVPSRYAHLVEKGSRKMKAEPFMIPAVESQERPYLDRCRAAGKQAEKDLAEIGNASATGGGLL